MHRRSFVAASSTLVAGFAGCVGILSGGKPASKKLAEAGTALVDVHDAWYTRRLDLVPEGGEVSFEERAITDAIGTARERLNAVSPSSDRLRRKVEVLRTVLTAVERFAGQLPAVERLVEAFLDVTDDLVAGNLQAVAERVPTLRSDAGSIAAELSAVHETVEGVDRGILERGEPFEDYEVGPMVEWSTPVEVVRDYVLGFEAVLMGYAELLEGRDRLRAAREAIAAGNYEAAAAELDEAANAVLGLENRVSKLLASLAPDAYHEPFRPAKCIASDAAELIHSDIDRAEVALHDDQYDRAATDVENALSNFSFPGC